VEALSQEMGTKAFGRSFWLISRNIPALTWTSMVDFSVIAKLADVYSLVNWTNSIWSFWDLIYSELWNLVKESNLLLRWIFEFTKTEFRHLNHLLFYCRLPIFLAYSGLWIQNSVYVSHSPWRNNYWHVIIWYLADCAVGCQIFFVRNLIKAKTLHRYFSSKKLYTRFKYLFKDDIQLCCHNSVIPKNSPVRHNSFIIKANPLLQNFVMDLWIRYS
jgi:hypothetical protein